MEKISTILILIAVSLFSLSLALPTINSNIDDPNMIVYLNADEGSLMDIIWRYYSGEKRKSFLIDFDYGLEMFYLAKFARFVPPDLFLFSPGSFVLILRWLHLLAWILSFFALWRLVKRHFGDTWQAQIAVILLAIRPAFAYFSGNLKPEPLVLLIMLFGLDYTLRIIDEPLKKGALVMAAACASAAFLVKYAGLFLLPAIIASMFFANRYHSNGHSKQNIFKQIKISWIFPSIIGLVIMLLPLLTMFLYVRKSTGATWYGQYGFWGSLKQNKTILCFGIIGFVSILLSFLALLVNKIRRSFLKKITNLINELNSYALVALGIFLGFTLLIGFGWIINPMHFITIYAQMWSNASATLVASATRSFADRIQTLDPIVMFLFMCYIVVEIGKRRQNFKDNLPQFYKRLTLLCFLFIPFLAMFSKIRMAQHHVLPFFAVISILGVQGLHMARHSLSNKKTLRSVATAFVAILLLYDVSANGIDTVKARTFQFHQQENIAYAIKKWWHKNIPANTKIAADHYVHAYIPSGYRNVKTLNWNEADRASGLRRLIDEHHPELVYYNEKPNREEKSPMPPIKELLSDKKEAKLVKFFENSPNPYQTNRNLRFVFYKISYQK